MKHAEACDERIHEVIFETLERQQKLFVLLLLIWGGSLAFVWWRWLAVNRLHEETSSTLRKLSRAVDQAGEFIMITDRNGMVEYVNPAFGRISGFADEEIIGQHVSLLGSGESSEPYLEQFDGTLPHDKEWHGEFTASRKSGDRYPAMMSISPIRGQSGEISHYVVIQQDMSDHEALQEQLRQSMKMESIGTLAGGIAHDFNNILAGFMGNIFLIRRDLKTANPSTLNQLATLEKLSQSAAKMVSQLLTFARKDIVRMQPFEFTPFFDLAVELARTVVPANVDFHHKNCTEGVQVFGSDNQLQQILINMVANANFAVKETDDPFILISAVPYVVDEAFREKHREVLASEFVRISVADNGCGISAEQIEKIFEPFYTTKEAGEGTGLGLSMVYGAVQRHGGVVEVESRLQEGTTFTIYLPQHEAGKADDAGENQDVVRGGGETILIVDDDFQVVETNRQLLLALGYNVLEAHDGLEAVEVYKGHIGQIDVVIMDCVMPKMGGAIAAKLIYKVDPQAKIIFMTGYDNEATIDEEFATPRTQMLFKPCSPGKLSQAIHKELESCC
jgi:PAS domain S-box-containing protein